MKKFYQFEWHGIHFNTFSKISRNHLPDSNFYDKFYSEFFNRFKSYDDLDQGWVIYKKRIAEYLSKIIGKNSKVLSIGSGIGIVEKYLFEITKNENISAIEPSENACKWIKDHPYITTIYGYFPECLIEKKRI